jgi:hypothetical protein
MTWIDVRISPLIIRNERNQWECTENGMKEFMAAVPYEDEKHPGKQFWWIRHCVIEDEIGLCVVGDDENVPAGWEIESITHYFHLPEQPKF